MSSLIQFKDANGQVITSLPSSYSAVRSFSVVLLGSGSTTIKAEILLNTKKVGEVSWSPSGGSKEKWYSGASFNTAVKQGDVFTVTLVSGATGSKTLPVNRPQPQIVQSDLRRLASFIGKDKQDCGPGVKEPLVLKTLLTRLSEDYPNLGVKMTPDPSRNIRNVMRLIEDDLELPLVNLLAYGTASETSAAISTRVPPTEADIFSKWHRFSDNAYYPNGKSAANDANAWTWNSSLGSAVQPLNSNYQTGFISLDTMEEYEIDVTVQSSNGDDDMNGLILAFSRVGSENRYLAVHVHQGGVGPTFSHSIGYYVGKTRQTIIGTDFAGMNKNGGGGSGTDSLGWNNRFTRVKATRSGNNFKVLSSKWNSMDLDPASLLEITLDDSPMYSQFKGEKPWGFMNHSQAGSYFKILSIKGAMNYTVLVNALENKVYEYTGSAWVQMIGVTLKDLFGAPRKIRNPETGKAYFIAKDGTVTQLA